MKIQNIFIGLLIVAVAVLGVITYQQQHYIQQLANTQQDKSIMKKIKDLDSRIDGLESDMDDLASRVDDLDSRLGDVEDSPAQTIINENYDADTDELRSRLIDAEGNMARMQQHLNDTDSDLDNLKFWNNLQ